MPVAPVHEMIKGLTLALALCCAQRWCGNCATFTNPVFNGGADPWIIFSQGYYYLTFTTGQNVQIRAATRLTGTNGIGRVPVSTYFSPPPPYNQNVWAPELHFLDGKAYLYYAA